MRGLVLLAPFVLLILPTPTASAEESFGCHSFEVVVGDRSEGVGVSPDDGAWYVATQRAPGGLYVVSDGQPVSGEGVFSIWFYEESNGEAGLQRGDESCDETDGWQREPDCSILCGF